MEELVELSLMYDEVYANYRLTKSTMVDFGATHNFMMKT